MEERILTGAQLAAFGAQLSTAERSLSTVEKYTRSARAFLAFLDGRAVTPALVTAWKADLLEHGHAPVTVNSMLAALNSLFRFLGWNDCRAHFLKIQRRVFRESGRELTRAEYDRLVSTAAEHGKARLALLLETMAATGIRVSEVKFITDEAARQGRAEIRLKGKIRTILLPAKLCRKLLKYAKTQKPLRERSF